MINPIPCQADCPKPLPPIPHDNDGEETIIPPAPTPTPTPDPKIDPCIAENFYRVWSNVTQWPDGVLPSDGDNVTINCNWTILMDLDPAPMNVF